jgi:hypothetical protein
VLKWTCNSMATWVTAVDISDDGSTVLAGTLVNTSPPSGTLSMFDAASSTPLWVLTNFGDMVSSVSLSSHGLVGAATSWGRKTSTFGYVLAVFKRDMWFPLEYSINDDQIFGVGSFLSVEVSDDGTKAVASARQGHARTLGSGGAVFALQLQGETSDVGAPAPPAAPPSSWALDDGRPNPANPLAVLPYRVPDEGARVDLAIFDVNGRLVRSLIAGAVRSGRQEAVWDGRDDAGRTLPSGLYFYRLRGDGFDETRKLILAR